MQREKQIRVIMQRHAHFLPESYLDDVWLNRQCLVYIVFVFFTLWFCPSWLIHCICVSTVSRQTYGNNQHLWYYIAQLITVSQLWIQNFFDMALRGKIRCFNHVHIFKSTESLRRYHKLIIICLLVTIQKHGCEPCVSVCARYTKGTVS